MDLDDIRQLLEAEGFVASLERATPDAPLDQLIVVLEPEDGADRLALQIAFLPDPDAEIEHARLLQFYVGLPEELAAPGPAALYPRLARINRSLPIGALHLHDELGAIYFRHVMLLPRGNVPAVGPVIVEAVWLVDYVLERVVAELAAA